MDSNTVTAIFTAVAGVAAVVAAIVAIVTLLQLRRDSHDRARPVIIARFEWPPLSHSQTLVIENVGGSAARDVQVTFEPDPLIIEGDPREPRLAKYLVDRYAKPIKLLAVGERLSNVYYSDQGKENVEPLPNEVRVKLTYSDIERRRKKYSDTFDLDINRFLFESFSEPGDKDWVKRAAKAAEAIAYGIGRHP